MTNTVTNRSQAAQVASLIRKELKQLFPLVKFNIHSKNYTGGDSVTVEYYDFLKREKIEAITDKYQYGHFDSMNDIYEYSNSREDIPQTKYLFVNRNMSDVIRTQIINEIKTTYANCEDFTGEGWNEQYGNEYSMVRRLFNEREY